MPGAGVRVKGKKAGTSADSEGYYMLEAAIKKGDVILYSFIGMLDERREYRGQKTLDVIMSQNRSALDEVVVVAHQNINELDIRSRSGVVQEVDMARIKSKPMISMGLALQGAVPGLVVTNTGDLGQKPKIRIRGNSSFRKGDIANEPLYVKDGQVISAEAFLTLNPMDIKEIKVLKDAVACALYGIKAANGVIEITSIRGNSEGRVMTNYSFNMGITTKGRRGVEMMDTAEKLELERLLKNPLAPGYRYSEDYIIKHFAGSPDIEKILKRGRFVLDSLGSIHTDWFNELIRINTYQRHSLSVRGGNENTAFSLSGGYSEQGGRIKGNETHNYSIGASLDQKLGTMGYLSVSGNAGYVYRNTPNGSSENPADLVYKLNPYETGKGHLYSYPNGEYTFSDLLHQYRKKGTDKRADISASLNLKPFGGLSFDSVVGLDILLNEEMAIVPSTSIKERTSHHKEEALGRLDKDKNVIMNISANSRLTYNKIFADKHDFTAGLNYDWYLSQYDMIGITGYGVGTLMYPAAINHSLKGERRPAIRAGKETDVQLGVGLVLGYTYDNKYDLFATYKADASSVLPRAKCWNGAWAAGFGWTPSRYGFLKDSKVLTKLNMRASFGRIANMAGVTADATVGTFSYSTDYYSNARLLRLLALYNLDLKPEQTSTYDAGLSIGFFKRITLDFNIYRRETEEALLDVPIPLSNGFNTMKRNIGVLRNEGVEVGAMLKILDGERWRLSLRGNMAYNRNKVVDLYFTDRLYASESALIPDYEIGQPYDILYGLRSLGINPITGLPVFKGADGSEIPAYKNVSKENIFALGHSTPPFTGSFSMGLAYRNFELDMDFYYVFGGIRSYSYTYIRSMDNSYLNAAKGQVDNMWLRKGDEGKKYHSPFFSSSSIHSLDFPNTRTVGKSDFLRMSMLSVRYRLPEKFLERYIRVVRFASVAFQASNLFTVTPYLESDPETGTLAGTLQPVITLNINLTF